MWRGRNIYYTHWGNGIGSNDWSSCNSLFLFSEFHLPRAAYVTHALGWQDAPATDAMLRCANGQHPTGPVQEFAELHCIRWQKQIACRGSVRNISADGVAGKMNLFTTMDIGVFLKCFPSLFPGAPEPQAPKAEGGKGKTNGEKLREYLVQINEKSVRIEGDAVAKAVGIPVKEVGRAFKSRVMKSLRASGWNLIPGNGKAAAPILKRTPIEIRYGDKCFVL